MTTLPAPLPILLGEAEAQLPDTTLQMIEVVVDLMDSNDKIIGKLDRVADSGGQIKYSNSQSVHSGGQLTVINDKDVDWEKVRVSPRVTAIDSKGAEFEKRLGVFVPSTPKGDWSDDVGVERPVSLVDKLSILDNIVPLDEYDDPVGFYSVPAGAEVLRTVKDLIENAGLGDTPMIVPDGHQVANMRTYKPENSTLDIINDMLNAYNYFSMYCDDNGQFHVDKYISPADRPVKYRGRTLFDIDDGETAVVPQFSIERDISTIPNMYVLQGMGDGTNPPEWAFAKDYDDSEFSYVQRGRWIVRISADDADTDTTMSLQARANRGLNRAQMINSKIPVQHSYMPGLSINEVVEFKMPEHMSGRDIIASVASTTVPFDYDVPCTTNLHAIVENAS